MKGEVGIQDSQADKIELIEYLQSKVHMPVKSAQEITAYFQLQQLAKGDILLEKGNVSNHSHLLTEGFIRSFTFNIYDNEVTTGIYHPTSLGNIFMSYFKGYEVKESYQALTNCRVWHISAEDTQTCFKHYSSFRKLGRVLLAHNHIYLHQRMLDMIETPAEERYLKLMASKPEIIQAVPLKVIASYLNITATSLSRIRREIYK
ncbi:MAG: Crp/Fnr family transcriptional regulator [Bacteroidota bacterium]